MVGDECNPPQNVAKAFLLKLHFPCILDTLGLVDVFLYTIEKIVHRALFALLYND